MQISKALLQATKLTLDALFKASNADIRMHDTEKIPKDQPIMYVVNHFTRMETTFLPYLMHKHTGKYTLSLAAHEFFSGSLGKIMQKLGAVSTKDPDRDKIFLHALLTGDYSTVIFPEGQMIKDKKLIEKGKYMIYNAGVLRRPPHTGAANLALKAQFFRKKLRYLFENNCEEALVEFITYFNIDRNDIPRIINLETCIVPVNITYYPIRARNNAINKLLDRFVGSVPERLSEELAIEGAMVIDGVDIDINFGDPIPAIGYLNNSQTIMNEISNCSLFLNHKDFEAAVPLTVLSTSLMQKYMNSIYSMTTVNHDHILAYILCAYSRNKIDETDFKNRANLAIERIREIGLTNFHSSLGKRQNFLPADDFHDKFNSFIEACVSAGIVTYEGGIIRRNPKKFNLNHPFHSIRLDNIAEVLRNEIEPMPELMKMLAKIMWIPSFWIPGMIRKKFIKIDLEMFEQDYDRFYLADESKPPEIGRPYFMKPFFARKGVILVHGYMAAPEEMKVLAGHLYRKGYAVYGVRLRGHGTSPEDLAGRTWEEWYDSVNRGYVVMKNSVKHFVIAGFSTGAGLALLQASYKGKKLKGMIAISAPLKLQNVTSRLSSAVVMWNSLLEKMNINTGRMEFIDNEPENPEINYLRNPVHGVSELGKLMNNVEERLGKINIPSLIIQGTNDPVVNPKSAQEIFQGIVTRDKQICMIDSARHGIVRGDESKEVAAVINAFLKKIF